MNMIEIFILCGIVGWVAGYVGSLMLTKRMSLVGGSLGHLTIPGMALAIIYGFDLSIGALSILLLGILIIWLLELKTKLPIEAITAVVFASSVAFAFLFLPENEAYPVLIGEISNVNLMLVASYAVLSIIIFIIIQKLYHKLILITISPDLAIAEKINVKKYNLIYLICIAVIISLGVRVVGGLMTAALVAIPAATSRNISKNLKEYSYLSAFMGALSCVIGVMAGILTNLNPGPLIILTSACLFLFSLILNK